MVGGGGRRGDEGLRRGWGRSEMGGRTLGEQTEPGDDDCRHPQHVRTLYVKARTTKIERCRGLAGSLWKHLLCLLLDSV